MALRLAVLAAIALFGLTACDGSAPESELSEADFADEFEEILCGHYADCDPDADCTGLVDGVIDTACVYDAEAAQACIDGDFTCSDEGDSPYVDWNLACIDAYLCDGESAVWNGTGTETTGTTTTTEPS